MPSPKSRGQGRRRIILPVAVLLALVTTAYFVVFAQRNDAPTRIGNRSEFSDSACMAYSPTGNDRHLTVFIDPGHGGPDPGAGGAGPQGAPLLEKTVTLAVARDLLPRLQGDGYRVVLSRTQDTAVAQPRAGDISGGLYTIAGEHADLAARIDCANAAGAALLLSIHFDSYNDPTVGGVETLYDPSRPFSNNNLRFAQDVQGAVLTALSKQGWMVPDRGVQSDTSAGTPALTAQGAAYGHLYLLGPAAAGWLANPSSMPGALCEPLFLTDPGEAAVAASSQGQVVLARAFEAAINRYFASSAHGAT